MKADGKIGLKLLWIEYSLYRGSKLHHILLCSRLFLNGVWSYEAVSPCCCNHNVSICCLDLFDTRFASNFAISEHGGLSTYIICKNIDMKGGMNQSTHFFD